MRASVLEKDEQRLSDYLSMRLKNSELEAQLHGLPGKNATVNDK